MNKDDGMACVPVSSMSLQNSLTGRQKSPLFASKCERNLDLAINRESSVNECAGSDLAYNIKSLSV